MSRFESIKNSIAETRSILRKRFGKYLVKNQHRYVKPKQSGLLKDEAVLKLLLNVDIQFGSSVEKAKAIYEDVRKGNSKIPEFNDLSSLGWIRITWGRFFTKTDSARLLKDERSEFHVILEQVFAGRFHHEFSFKPETKQDSELSPVLETFQKEYGDGQFLDCSSPEWVAARLWERAPKQNNLTERLRYWVDRCTLVKGYGFTPSIVWDVDTAQKFKEAVLDVLRKDSNFPSWDQMREGLVAHLALISKTTRAEADLRIPVIPITNVDRYLWLEGRLIGHMRDDHFTFEDTFNLVNLLLREIEDADRSSVPHPVAKALFDLSLEKPELLSFIIRRIQQDPILIADMLLEPKLSALSCLLVASWPSEGGAWDRDLIDRDGRFARLETFTDSVAVLCYFITMDLVDPREVSSLLSWMQRNIDEKMFSIIRFELARQTPDVLKKIADACMTYLPTTGLGKPEFAAAIEVVTFGLLSDTVPPEPFIEAYLRSVRSGDYSLNASGINPSTSRALLQLVVRGSAEKRKEFLSPIDMPTLLEKLKEHGANSFEIKDQLSRSLRAHIRVLCRAISGWEDVPPPDFVDALIWAVRSGAFDNPENNRIPAFSARYETKIHGGNNERPLADDLGEALVNLTGDDRERLLKTILETNEPLLLAQLLGKVPPDIRGRIQIRINDLSPDNAGKMTSLTEIQARIEELLSAGALDAADKFIAIEKDLQTMGKVLDRELKNFRYEMKLKFLRKDFEGISKMVIPADLEKTHIPEATDILDFYKALAEIVKPDGKLDIAEKNLNRLHKSRSDIALYVVNLFSLQVSRILAGDLFQRLRGAEAAKARKALVELDAAMSHCRGIGDADFAINALNKAMLFLAIEKPEKAYDTLTSIPESERQDKVSALLALSLSRMGRNTEATAAIDLAEKLYGQTEVLRAVRAQIQRGTPLDERASVTSVDDNVVRIKTALFDFQLMEPSSQAKVIGQSGSFDAMVIDHVRAVSSEVIALLPMMKEHEDDITALIQALLVQRLLFVRWTLRDQSKGGFTAKGNPGERDLVLSKDGIDLAVLEAVVCKRPPAHQWTKDNLTSHFQKLFSYGTCHLFFHLTYSYVENPGEVLKLLKVTAEKEVPTGFTFNGTKEIISTDSMPPGFVSTYDSSLVEVKVIFLILDMKQSAQRGAAKTAAIKNPR